jgi:ABC-2 type transport system ATP-binding protein
MVIELQGIHKAFTSGFLMKRQPVLQGLDLHVHQGDTYALLGANGAGKSTTIRILLGLSTADAGQGSVLGSPLGSVAARRRLGYLPENPSFHEQLTHAEFLRYSGQLLGMPGRQLSGRIDMLLEKVQLQDARNRRLRKLSKGMCQRLGLAQVLLGDPELLILDEPMSGLDPPGRKMVRDLILEQRDAGKTVLFSTHILGDAEAVCTRAGILRSGQLARELNIDEMATFNSGVVDVHVSGLSPERIAALESAGYRCVAHGVSVVVSAEGGDRTQEALRRLLEWDAQVLSVMPRQASLEEVYMRTQSMAARAEDSPRETPVATSRLEEVRR